MLWTRVSVRRTASSNWSTGVGSCSGRRLAVPGPGAPDHTEVIRRADNPGRGAQNGPESIWGEDGPGAQMRSVDCGVAGLAQRLPSVGQQYFDPPRGMGADSVQHIAEVDLRVDPQVLARRAQACQNGRRLAYLVVSCE
jgi:hypothetical protein